MGTVLRWEAVVKPLALAWSGCVLKGVGLVGAVGVACGVVATLAVMAERTLIVDGETSLAECYAQAGCVVGDRLTLVGRTVGGARVYSSSANRPRLSGLTVEECTLDVGSGVWLLGYPSKPCEVRLRGCVVRGPGSGKSVQDVFMGCRLAEVSGCRWVGTRNGPVGAELVEGCGFDDIGSDVLSGCREVRDCIVRGVVGGGGLHPDVHQVFEPGWTSDRGVFAVRIRGLRVGGADCNGQYVHWTVLGTPEDRGLLDAEVSDSVFGDRRAGAVWSSRITCDCARLEWRGVRFGQPLHMGMGRLDCGVFVDCEFRKGIYASDAETRELLDGCEWRGVSVGSVTGAGVYVPPNARVEIGS